MNKLDFLNSFLTERLMVAAGEIFEVFKDTVSEYEAVIERIKEENRCLRNTLLAQTDIHRVHQRTGSQSSYADGVKKHSSNPEALDSEPSLIQVKLELATLKQEPESLSNPYTCSSSRSVSVYDADSAQIASERTLELKEDEDKGQNTKAEPSVSFSSAIRHPSELPDEEEVGADQDPFSCSYCAQTFEEVSHLTAHLESHMALFNCDVCGKSFKNKGTLRTHMIVHQKEKPFRCRLCGKSYSCAKVLNVHLISHTGERPFGCGYCEKRFKLKSHLKEHERIHTGEKPFSCPVCMKCFTRSNAVKIHLRNHHREQLQFALNQ